MSVKEKNRVQVLNHYKANPPSFLVKTLFKWRWGLPLPYLAFFSDKIEVVAVRRGEPYVYISLKKTDVNFVRVAGNSVCIGTNDQEFVIELDREDTTYELA